MKKICKWLHLNLDSPLNTSFFKVSNKEKQNKEALLLLNVKHVLSHWPMCQNWHKAIKKYFMHFVFKLTLFVFPIPIQAKIY